MLSLFFESKFGGVKLLKWLKWGLPSVKCELTSLQNKTKGPILFDLQSGAQTENLPSSPSCYFSLTDRLGTKKRYHTWNWKDRFLPVGARTDIFQEKLLLQALTLTALSRAEIQLQQSFGRRSVRARPTTPAGFSQVRQIRALQTQDSSFPKRGICPVFVTFLETKK